MSVESVRTVEPAATSHGAECGCSRCLGFTAGNTVAEKHGSYASDLSLSKDKRVGELFESIRATQPVWSECDAGSAWRLALVYRRLELSAAALETADGIVAEMVGGALSGYQARTDWLDRLRADHDRWLNAAGKIEAALGRTPASRAKLGMHIATARRSWTLSELHAAAADERGAP